MDFLSKSTLFKTVQEMHVFGGGRWGGREWLNQFGYSDPGVSSVRSLRKSARSSEEVAGSPTEEPHPDPGSQACGAAEGQLD